MSSSLFRVYYGKSRKQTFTPSAVDPYSEACYQMRRKGLIISSLSVQHAANKAHAKAKTYISIAQEKLPSTTGLGSSLPSKFRESPANSAFETPKNAFVLLGKVVCALWEAYTTHKQDR